jgi:hypothetical protein
VPEGYQVTPADDDFHRPPTDDPWWNETAWFSFMVPERALYCYVYPWVRPNLGLHGGGVMVWDDRGRYPWEAVHWNYQWHHPYPELGDLRDVVFPTGVRIQCQESMQRYRVAYDHPDCSLDVVFDAIVPPHALGGADDTTGTFAGHIDQQGRVTGRLVLAGESFTVDCYGVRDRSWGRRVPTPGMHIGYDIATGPASGFMVFSSPDAPGQPIVDGFGHLWLDGQQAPMASGSRTIERDGVWPQRVVIAGHDRLGRRLDAVGTPMNWMLFQNLPSMVNLVSLVRWDFTGPDGRPQQCWGELEDVWDVDLYRRFVRG